MDSFLIGIAVFCSNTRSPHLREENRRACCLGKDITKTSLKWDCLFSLYQSSSAHLAFILLWWIHIWPNWAVKVPWKVIHVGERPLKLENICQQRRGWLEKDIFASYWTCTRNWSGLWTPVSTRSLSAFGRYLAHQTFAADTWNRVKYIHLKWMSSKGRCLILTQKSWRGV